MLHITHGDSVVSGIRETAPGGDVVSWMDVLHEGPVPSNLDLEELRRVRAEFIASCGWADFDQTLSLMTSIGCSEGGRAQNNITRALRHLTVFGVFGSGDY